MFCQVHKVFSGRKKKKTDYASVREPKKPTKTQSHKMRTHSLLLTDFDFLRKTVVGHLKLLVVPGNDAV